MLKASCQLLFLFRGSGSKINPGNWALLSREAASKEGYVGTGTGWGSMLERWGHHPMICSSDHLHSNLQRRVQKESYKKWLYLSASQLWLRSRTTEIPRCKPQESSVLLTTDWPQGFFFPLFFSDVFSFLFFSSPPPTLPQYCQLFAYLAGFFYIPSLTSPLQSKLSIMLGT